MVLVLVGILAGVVGLSLGNGGRSDVAGQEADLLVARLNRAADEVALTGVPLGFVWAAEGYRFNSYDDETGGWISHALPILNEAHLLPRGTHIAGSAGEMILSSDMRPPGDEPLTLELASIAGVSEKISFDGVNATRVEAVE